MFRLSSRQLHILFGFLVVAMLIIGGIFLFENHNPIILKGKLSQIDNMSEGWIASYETLDDAKWRKYGNSDDKDAKKIVTEVLNLPNSFDVKSGNLVTLTHKIPDFEEDTLYIVVNTEKQAVEVMADIDTIYEIKDRDMDFPFHVIPIDHKYRDTNLIVKIVNDSSNKITFDEVKIGSYTELMAYAFTENGVLVVFGAFLILLGAIVIVICLLMKTDASKKQMLTYIGVEALLAGCLLVVYSRLFRVFIRWELINYYLRSVMIIIVSVAHLLVLRCLIRRKRILTVVDIGIMIYCIMFVSVMVLQWFRLITLVTVNYISLGAFFVGLIIYTLLMGSAAYDYKQRDEKPVFISNIIFVCAVVIEIVLYITDYNDAKVGLPIVIGSLAYFIILINYSIKRAVIQDEVKIDPEDNTRIIREQMIDQFNPKLLFASFQTLQKLIKNGSENSTKMIYYISVYVMNNIKAMTSAGEIIPFKEELEHIMAYLQLQKMRNRGFSFAIESKVTDFKIPRNTLEPLVENAVKYGVGGKDNKGNVVVRSYERKDGYAIQIIDDGIGFDTKIIKKSSSPTSINNLLYILEDKCMANTEIISKEGKGTVITIIIPMIENELL